MRDTIQREQFSTGDILFKEGEAGDSAYLIESGGIQIMVQRDDQDVVIAELGAGELIGEMALLDHKPRTATAIVTSDTTIIPIHRQDLNHRLETSDQAEQILNIFSESGIDPNCLKLEITETMLIRDPEMAGKILDRLKKAGIKISLDDFGTGYASLSYLQRYPIDVIKVDRSFVSKMLTQNDSLQIVRATLSLAQKLGMDVVAEGIETIDELERLVKYGCNFIQGYYFSRPLPLSEVLDYCRQDVVIGH